MSERSGNVNLSCFKAYTLDDSLEKAKQSVNALRERAEANYKINCKVLDDAIKHMDAEFSTVFPDGNESAPLKLSAQVQQMEDKRQLIALLSCNQLNNIEQHINIQLRDMIMDVKESNGLLAPRKLDPEPVVTQENNKNTIIKGTLEAVKQATTPPCSVELTQPTPAKKEQQSPAKPAAKKPEKKRASFTNGIRKMRDNLKTRRAEKNKKKEASMERKLKNKESRQSTEEKPKNRVQLLRQKKSVNVATPATAKTPVTLNCTTPESSVKQVEEGNNVAHTPPPQSSPKKADAKKNAKPWYQLW